MLNPPTKKQLVSLMLVLSSFAISGPTGAIEANQSLGAECGPPLARVNEAARSSINPWARRCINPEAAATINPCAAKTLNAAAAQTLNPAAARTLNAEAAETLNARAARTLNACAAKTLNPRAAKTLNPCAAKTLNPCAARTLNPLAAKTLNAEAAKTLNACAARWLNPCAAKTLNASGARTLNPCKAKGLTPRAARSLPAEFGPSSASRGDHAGHDHPLHSANPCSAQNARGARGVGNPCSPQNPCRPSNPCGRHAQSNAFEYCAQDDALCGILKKEMEELARTPTSSQAVRDTKPLPKASMPLVALTVTSSDDPLVSDECRRAAFEATVEHAGSRRELLEHLNRETENWKRAHAGTLKMTFQDYMRHTGQCDRFCGPMVQLLVKCHLDELARAEKEVAVFDTGHPRPGLENQFRLDDRSRSRIRGLASRATRNGNDRIVLYGRASRLSLSERYSPNVSLADRRLRVVERELRQAGYLGQIDSRPIVWEPPRLSVFEIAEKVGFANVFRSVPTPFYLDQSVIAVVY